MYSTDLFSLPCLSVVPSVFPSCAFLLALCCLSGVPVLAWSWSCCPELFLHGLATRLCSSRVHRSLAFRLFFSLIIFFGGDNLKTFCQEDISPALFIYYFLLYLFIYIYIFFFHLLIYLFYFILFYLFILFYFLFIYFFCLT